MKIVSSFAKKNYEKIYAMIISQFWFILLVSKSSQHQVYKILKKGGNNFNYAPNEKQQREQHSKMIFQGKCLPCIFMKI